ncbi:MAG: hypothetical protein E8D49_01550 [Nitrospira sp.]|nr:MAG: hypothetical protein E8D49_01550 [Nitrospira sp.]
MTIRRGIIFAYILCGAFLVAHIINAVIAEALSVPSGSVRPSPVSDREGEAKTSASAMIESIQKSGLFPLPPDPVSASATGSGAPPLPRVPLNLASKLKLLGVVMGDHEGVSAIVEELSSKRQLFFRLHDHIPDIGEISEIPCTHPRNKSSSTAGCHSTATKNSRENICRHGKGWTTTRKGKTNQTTAPMANEERKIGER